MTKYVTNVTCGLTAKESGSAPCPTLVIEYGTTLLFYLLEVTHSCSDTCIVRYATITDTWHHKHDWTHLYHCGQIIQTPRCTVWTLGDQFLTAARPHLWKICLIT